MSHDDYFALGTTITLGSHTFEPDEIKEFARKYDPQLFHIDEAEAERSVFGRLCASGWHTASMWMRYNLKKREDMGARPWDGPGPRPEFGPLARLYRPQMAAARLCWRHDHLHADRAQPSCDEHAPRLAHTHHPLRGA